VPFAPPHHPPTPHPPPTPARFLDDGSGQRARVEGTRAARLRTDALEMRQDYREKAEGAGLQSLAQFFTGHKSQGYKRKVGAGGGGERPRDAAAGRARGGRLEVPRPRSIRPPPNATHPTARPLAPPPPPFSPQESFLPVGAVVTVVGELARNALPGTGGGARFVVRPPPRGDFVITSQTAAQLHAGFAKLSFVYKSIALAFGGLGAYLIARKALRRWLRGRRERAARRALQAAIKAREQRRAAAAAAGGGGAAAGGAAAEEEEGADRERDTCVVCLEGQASIVYTACGHMCVCVGCSKALKRCPVCRTQSDSIKVFRM
jgi:hypothetical protein